MSLKTLIAEHDQHGRSLAIVARENHGLVFGLRAASTVLATLSRDYGHLDIELRRGLIAAMQTIDRLADLVEDDTGAPV